jgi:hypothetical protein
MKRRTPFLLIASLILTAQALTAASAQSEQLAVLSFSSYTDSVGYYHVVGEVQNRGSNVLSQVRIAATLCDSLGQTAGTIEDYTMISLLEPQEKSPFDLFENVTGSVCKVSVLNCTTSNEIPYSDFQILSESSSLDSEGTYHITGEVKNSGNATALSVEAVGTFYDAKGIVVQVGSSLVSPSDLQPGQTGSFDVMSDDPAMTAQIANFALQIQCALPILPIPELADLVQTSIVALAVALVLARRRTPSCLN